MTYYKFLAAGAIGPFSGYAWSRDWVLATGTASEEPGVYACRVADLPYWLHDELWLIELDGPVSATGRTVVAPRGRLTARVTAWDASAAADYARACVGRTAWHAAQECADLDDGSLRTAAEELGRPDPVAGLANVRELALRAQDAATRAGRLSAARVCGYLADAVQMAGDYPVAAMGYVAARAAAARAADPSGDRYLAERRWQAAWLADRLALVG